ncbi:MAG TPA: flavodoxin family protein [Candidatus Anoxymicrobiaceae bacterium]|jgi:multimeric flavodoxin WrbA
MKIVAINGSLIPGGNVEALLDHALGEYDGDPRFNIRRFSLSSIEVNPCRQCNWCLRKQEPDRFCFQDDGMTGIYPELMAASGVIIATPVHFGRLSGTTADFIDRLRVFVHGNITRGAMRNKVGGALAVAWFRNAGLEQTLVTVTTAFQVLNMVIATPDIGVLGGAAYSSLEGKGATLKGERLLVLEDELGMASARSVAYRVSELAALLDAGKQALL